MYKCFQMYLSKGTYVFIQCCRYAYGKYWNMAANLDVTDNRCSIQGEMIATNPTHIESGHHTMGITPPEPCAAVTLSFSSGADLLRCKIWTTGLEQKKRNGKENRLLNNYAIYVLVQTHQCCDQLTPYGSLLVDQVNGTPPLPLHCEPDVIKLCAVEICIP